MDGSNGLYNTMNMNAVAYAILLCSLYVTNINGFLIVRNIGDVGVSLFHMRAQRSIPTHQKISASLANANAASSETSDMAAPVIHNVYVDYSAANEYIRAHYNQSQYFEHEGDSLVDHQIYDGRMLQSHYENEKEMLNDNGLAIIQSPLSTDIRWLEAEDIQQLYLQELERIVHKLFPTNLINYSFWNPMLRGETLNISRQESSSVRKCIPTANVASLVHIDTDVGAYESIHELLDIVEKNKVSRMSSQNNMTVKEVANEIIHNKKRFAIINFWRNIGDTPVSSSPLAIMSTRYNSTNQKHHQPNAFPNAKPNTEESKWYVFPNATKDEVIVFYQYDRNVLQPSDLWHCAISTRSSSGKDETMSPPRKSFDIRAFVVFDESVPNELDRFNSDRTRPVLSFEESGCFCDEQAEDRKQKRTAKRSGA